MYFMGIVMSTNGNCDHASLCPPSLSPSSSLSLCLSVCLSVSLSLSFTHPLPLSLSRRAVALLATRDIAKGEEIYSSYFTVATS